jgi:hypothetical protein
MPYLLVANVFIQAKRLHYGMDFCPAFWDWLIAKNAANEVFSIERVGDELLAGGITSNIGTSPYALRADSQARHSGTAKVDE